MMNYFSVCTCAEGCDPRTKPEDCPMHAPQPSFETTTNATEWTYRVLSDTDLDRLWCEGLDLYREIYKSMS